MDLVHSFKPKEDRVPTGPGFRNSHRADAWLKKISGILSLNHGVISIIHTQRETSKMLIWTILTNVRCVWLTTESHTNNTLTCGHCLAIDMSRTAKQRVVNQVQHIHTYIHTARNAIDRHSADKSRAVYLWQRTSSTYVYYSKHPTNYTESVH